MTCLNRRFIRLALGVVSLLIAFGQQSVQSDEPGNEKFDEANLLYERGQYIEAALAYEEILSSGTRTPPLLFNTGNAYFKTEQIGRAMVNWLQAESLAPRNDRIQINLEFARKSISGGAQPIPLWPAQLKVLTLNEWAGMTLVCSWLCFTLLIVGTWKPKLRSRLRVATIVTAVGLVVTVALLVITARDRTSTVSAIVVTPEAVVRFGPLPESQSAFVARDGSEFRMTDMKDEWIRVEDATGREGWLTSDQVVLLRGGNTVDRMNSIGVE